jgi:nicotinamidase-related amidase
MGVTMKKHFCLVFVSLFFSISSFCDTPLVIIDMQNYWLNVDNFSYIPTFARAKEIDALVNSVVAKIEEAKSKNETIVILEQLLPRLGKLEDTDARIVEHLKGYEKVILLKKERPSGAKEIKSKFDELGIEPEGLKVCGVHTGNCVKDTVEDLIKIMPSLNHLTVIEDACAHLTDSQYHEKAINVLSRLPKVKIEKGSCGNL